MTNASLFSNLLSVPVLAFALGAVAFLLKTDIRIPDAAYKLVSMVLLFGIGLKGGVALHKIQITEVLVPLLITIGLGLLIPSLAYLGLKVFPQLSRIDRGAIAAHYGSTSLVTFTTALVFLEASNIPYESYVTTLLVAMEIPGILLGILFAAGIGKVIHNRELIREVFFGKTILLMVGGLVIGFAAGISGLEKVAPLFVDLQPAVLTLFLLTLGYVAMSNFKDFQVVGLRFGLFAIAFPVIAGAIGSAVGVMAGMSVGGATALAVLCASASYIAAPAACDIAIPEASKSLTLLSSIGITFPFNLAVGIPLYLWFAQTFSNYVG